MNEEKMNFEQALAELQKSAEEIKSPKLNLEDSIRCYEEGLKYYRICSNILSKTEQKIETVRERQGE